MSEGLVVVGSSRPFEDTLNALVASVKHRQVEVFDWSERRRSHPSGEICEDAAGRADP
jgi:hypothetical protein